MNQELTRQEITREPLAVLENNLVVIPRMYRDHDKEFGRKGAKIGSVLYQRMPARFIGRDGQAFQPEAYVETQVPVVVNQQIGQDLQFTSDEMKLSLDDFMIRIGRPAALSMANKWDLRALQTIMINTPNQVGTPGTTPGLNSLDAFDVYGQAGQKLLEMGFPYKVGIRTLIVNPVMERGWNTFTRTQFNPQAAVSRQWKSGQIEPFLGNDTYVDQNIPVQTIGLLGGTPTSNGANQTGNSILTTGWTPSITGILNVGDIISFAGVYAVNPQSRQSTGSLQQLTVQATANSDGSGNATLLISPAIVPSGQFQNVTNSPSVNALINVYNTAAAGQSALSGLASPQAVLFHENSFTFVSVPLDVPRGVNEAYLEDADGETNVKLRFVQQYIGATDQWISRYDSLGGISPMYSQGACRIAA